MEYCNRPNNGQRIILLKKIILSYLEQYMLYHIEQEVNSHMSLKNVIEEQNLRYLFRVLSKGLLLNIEQFIKSRQWMNNESASSIKNITITTINIIPEDQEKQSSFDLKHEVSSESLDLFERIIIPEESSNLGEVEHYKNEELIDPTKNDTDLTNTGADFIPGLILGKLSFISLSLASINKLLEITKRPAPSGTST